MTTPGPEHRLGRGHHHGARPELDGLEQVEVAVAFVDLAGYSVLTEMCGDHEAAELAPRTGAEIETMEGAAVHAVCERAGIPLLHLRCISNFCGDRERGDWQLGAAESLPVEAVAALLRALTAPAG